MNYYRRNNLLHPCHCQKPNPLDTDQCLGRINRGAVWIRWIVTRSSDTLDILNLSCICDHHPQAALLENWPFVRSKNLKKAANKRTNSELAKGNIKNKIWVF